MFQFLCQLAVHFCVAMSSQKSDNTIVTRQPLGCQMCITLCSTYGGRQSHTFDPVQLRCTFKQWTIKGRSCRDVNVITKVCSTRYSRTIHSRMMGLRNVTQTWTVSRNKTANNKVGAKNKEANKIGKDVTQKRRRENKLALVSVFTTWYGARELCKDRNSTLVVPKTKEDVDDIATFIHDHGHTIITLHFSSQCFWFGLSDAHRNNTIFWIDGGPLVHSSVIFGKQILFGESEAECGKFIVDRKKIIIDWCSVPCGKKCMLMCQK